MHLPNDLRVLSDAELEAILATCPPAERAALERMTDDELEMLTHMSEARAAAYIRERM